MQNDAQTPDLDEAIAHVKLVTPDAAPRTAADFSDNQEDGPEIDGAIATILNAVAAGQLVRADLTPAPQPEGQVMDGWVDDKTFIEPLTPALDAAQSECLRCGSVGGFGCYECTPLDAAQTEAVPVAWRYVERKFYRSEWPLTKLLEARNGGLVTDAGEAWTYRYSHKDGTGGEYDLLCRREPAAPAPDIAGAVEALADYQQADQDGAMVLVSRQAIEECLPALRALTGKGGAE